MSHPLIFVHVLDWSLRNHWTPAGYLILSWRCLNMPYMTIDIHCIPGNVKKRKLCTIRWSSQHDHINKYRTYSQCKSLTRRSCPTPLLCVKCVTDIAIFLCLSLVITGDALSLDWVSATVYESRNTELVFAGPGRMLVEAALSSPSVLETIGQKESCVLHTSFIKYNSKKQEGNSYFPSKCTWWQTQPADSGGRHRWFVSLSMVHYFA